MGMPKLRVYGHGKRVRRVDPPVRANCSFRLIHLGGQYFTIVDADDYEKFSNFYYALSNGYAMRHLPEGGSIGLHRDVMGSPPGKMVDHRNGDTLDNRKDNLRVCTRAQNFHNHRLSKRNKTGYTGVYLIEKTGQWTASIGFQGKLIYLGAFRLKHQAIQARRKAEKKYHGEYTPKTRRR